MQTYLLDDLQWQRIEQLCSGKASERGVTARDNRQFINAVIWVALAKEPWRNLPPSFGSWHSIYIRFNRWRKKGTWLPIIEALNGEPGLASTMLTLRKMTSVASTRRYRHAPRQEHRPAAA